MKKNAKTPTKVAPAKAPDATAQDALSILAGATVDSAAGPLYRQIIDILRAPIADGRLSPGQTLPREADLARFFGVSLITVRHALRDLASEGHVRKQSAKPAIVTAPLSKAKNRFNFKNIEAIIASTSDRHIEIVNYRQRQSARACEVFGLGRSKQVWCLEAVLHSNTRAVSHNVFYFPPAIGTNLKREDFDDVVVFRAVQRRLGIKLRDAHVSVRADVADKHLAKRLKYKAGAPIMEMEMIYYNMKGEPVELTINRSRADAFSLEFDVPNEQK
jgi:GntR family transcriptional regulator